MQGESAMSTSEFVKYCDIGAHNLISERSNISRIKTVSLSIWESVTIIFNNVFNNGLAFVSG